MVGTKDDAEVVAIRHDLIGLQDLIQAAWEAHNREHALRDDAIRVAREVVDHRLNNMNEMREQISRAELKYITRVEVETSMHSLEQTVDANAKSADGRFRTIERMVYMAAGATTIIMLIISATLAVIFKR